MTSRKQIAAGALDCLAAFKRYYLTSCLRSYILTCRPIYHLETVCFYLFKAAKGFKP